MLGLDGGAVPTGTSYLVPPPAPPSSSQPPNPFATYASLYTLDFSDETLDPDVFNFTTPIWSQKSPENPFGNLSAMFSDFSNDRDPDEEFPKISAVTHACANFIVPIDRDSSSTKSSSTNKKTTNVIADTGCGRHATGDLKLLRNIRKTAAF